MCELQQAKMTGGVVGEVVLHPSWQSQNAFNVINSVLFRAFVYLALWVARFHEIRHIWLRLAAIVGSSLTLFDLRTLP